MGMGLGGLGQLGRLGRPAPQEGGGSAQSYFSRVTSGFRYGFSDLTRLFTTSIGPTNVSAAGNSIGLFLDNLLWNDQTLAQVIAAGTERADVSLSIDASEGTGSSSQVGGTITCTGVDSSNHGGRFVPIATVAGGFYRVSWTQTGASLFTGAWDSRSGVSPNGSNFGTAATRSAGSNIYYFRATDTDAFLYFNTVGGGGSATITNVSVKAVTGKEALQATGGSQGSYQTSGILRVATDDTYSTTLLPGRFMMARAKLTGGSGTRAVAGASGSATARWNLYFNTSNQAACRVGDGVELAGAADRSNVDGTIGVRRRADDTIDLVIDGVVAASQAMSGSPTTVQAIAIGAINNNGAAGSFFTGDYLTGSNGASILAGDAAPTDAELLALHNYLMAA